MRFYLALWLAKFASFLLKIASKFTSMRGTNFPGEIALKICPEFIGIISKPEKIAVVTGTNGKTTTSNLLVSLLREFGFDVLSNEYGSNIKSGVATALLNGVTWRNRSTKEIALLEVDERSAIRIYPYMKPDYVVVTNLSRDTIMRNAHPEYIFRMLNTYLPDTAKMILNADDPISFRLKEHNPRVYYGFDQQPEDPVEDTHLVNDAKVCPVCHSMIKYKFLKYDHIGQVFCPDCGFASPTPDYAVETVDYASDRLKIRTSSGTNEFHLISDTTFNIYNEAACIALLTELGISAEIIAQGLEKVTIVDSRLREERCGNLRIAAIMSKGLTPACNAVLGYTVSQPGEKEVVLYLEDKHELAVSSERITWIWDSDFELLNDESITRIVITGFRRYDFYYRLLLGGISSKKIILVPAPEDVASQLNLSDGSSVFILNDIYSVPERDRMIRDIKNRIGGKV